MDEAHARFHPRRTALTRDGEFGGHVPRCPKEQCPTHACRAIRGFPGPNATRMTFDWIFAAVAGGVLAILLDVALVRAAGWLARIRRRT